MDHFLERCGALGGPPLGTLEGLKINGMQCVLQGKAMKAYRDFLNIWGGDKAPALVQKGPYESFNQSSGQLAGHVWGLAIDLKLNNPSDATRFATDQAHRIKFLQKFIGAAQKVGWKRLGWSPNGDTFHLDMMDKSIDSRVRENYWWIYAPVGDRYPSHPSQGASYPTGTNGPVYKENKDRLNNAYRYEAAKAYGSKVAGIMIAELIGPPTNMTMAEALQTPDVIAMTMLADGSQRSPDVIKQAANQYKASERTKYNALLIKQYQTMGLMTATAESAVSFTPGRDFVGLYPPELTGPKLPDMKSYAGMRL